MSDLLATGLLLKLDVTVWTGSAALSAPDLGLDPASIAAHYTLGRKRLVPKPALDPLATVVRQTRYALESLSHALPDGSRFILEATTPEVEAQLRRGQARFNAGVAAFLEAYPAHRAAMAAEWAAAAAAAWLTARCPGDEAAFIEVFLTRIAAAAPTPTELRRKFDFLLRKSPPGLQRALRARFRMRVSRGGLDHHLVALPFKSLDRAAPDPLGMQAIEVVGPQLAVGSLSRQHVVRGNQDAMAHRDDGLLVPAVAHETAVPGSQGTARPSRRRQGGLGQGRTQPAVPPSRLPRLVLARALVIAGTEARPAG
jgi:hypothetical protein